MDMISSGLDSFQGHSGALKQEFLLLYVLFGSGFHLNCEHFPLLLMHSIYLCVFEHVCVKGSGPEWYISSILCSWNIPLWSRTLDMQMHTCLLLLMWTYLVYNNNNDFISKALFHVKHAQLRCTMPMNNTHTHTHTRARARVKNIWWKNNSI